MEKPPTPRRLPSDLKNSNKIKNILLNSESVNTDKRKIDGNHGGMSPPTPRNLQTHYN